MPDDKKLNSSEDELEQIISAAINKKKQRAQDIKEISAELEKDDDELGSIISAAMEKKKQRAEKAVPASAEIKEEPESSPKEKPEPEKEQAPEEKKDTPEKPAAKSKMNDAAGLTLSDKADKAEKPKKPQTEHPKKSAASKAASGKAPNIRQGKKPLDPEDDETPRPRSKSSGEKTARPQDEEHKGAKKTSGKKKGKKKKLTIKQKTLTTIGIVFMVLCLLALVVFLVFHFYFNKLKGKDNRGINSAPMSYADTDSTKEDTFDPRTEEERLKDELERNAKDIMSDKDVFNVLLIGEDLRPETGDERGNTDVMMLLSLNKKLGTITMTSFMRDLYLYIPEIDTSDRLNAAYWYNGTECLRSTLQQYFAVNIDRYVIVNFNQFIEIVDTLGGLDIEITDDEAHGYESERYDPYGDNNRGMENPLDEQNHILGNKKGTDYLPELAKEGEVVHCNGNQALAYARLRHVDKGEKYSDFGRTERQREVISLIIKKAKGASLVQLNELANKILPDTYTDLEEGETASLLLHAFEYMGYDIQQLQIPAEGTYSGHFVDHKAVLLADLRENARLLQQTIYGTTVIEEQPASTDENGSVGDSSNPYDHNGYYDDNGNWIDYEDQYRYASTDEGGGGYNVFQ
ncbi:MAG: LCP family protein [Ruminococcus sp.]|nr:LCP family protein [Ruminococcus sp.]